MPKFSLVPGLAKKDYITDLKLCKVLMEKKEGFPWIFLVPKVANITQINQLSEKDRLQLNVEIQMASNIMEKLFPCDRINVAAIGNMTTQLHVHIICRNKSDVHWPDVCWNKPIEDMSEKDREMQVKKIRAEFNKQKKQKVVVIIPARMKSTRLPNKPMADINGKTMIQRIYENVSSMTNFPVYIACSEKEVYDHIKNIGGKAVMTNPSLPSGSDRIAQALKKIDSKGDKFDIVVNFQGDAVNTDPKIINELVALSKKTGADITTPGMIMDKRNHDNQNAVKIIAPIKKGKSEGRCLYFTRANAPVDRDNVGIELIHHIGLYVYKAESLRKFVKCKEGELEKKEKLEQLRALENGMTIYCKIVNKLKLNDKAPADIDTQEQLDEVRQYIK